MVKKVAPGAPFTGKELDEETGLYYFGARYYDPRTSVWQSADPILGKYLPGSAGDPPVIGVGGIYNAKNLAFYTYGYQNPLIVRDPDGNVGVFGAVVGVALDLGLQLYAINAGSQKDIDVASLFVSGLAGAAGAGLATKIAQASKLTKIERLGAELAAGAAVDVGSEVGKGNFEELTLQGVVADVVVGKAVGDLVGKSARSNANASAENKLLGRNADRAERIANNPKVGRPEARQRQAEAARGAQQNFLIDAEVKGGVIGSGAAGSGLDAWQKTPEEK